MILFGLEAYIGRIDIMCTMKATGELQIYLLTSFYLFKRTKQLKDERKVCSYRLNDKTETSYTETNRYYQQSSTTVFMIRSACSAIFYIY